MHHVIRLTRDGWRCTCGIAVTGVGTTTHAQKAMRNDSAEEHVFAFGGRIELGAVTE